MSKLREKFVNAIKHLRANEVDKCEQIADDFAVKFAEWVLNSNELYRLGMNETTTTELLQIFKTKYYE